MEHLLCLLVVISTLLDDSNNSSCIQLILKKKAAKLYLWCSYSIHLSAHSTASRLAEFILLTTPCAVGFYGWLVPSAWGIRLVGCTYSRCGCPIQAILIITFCLPDLSSAYSHEMEIIGIKYSCSFAGVAVLVLTIFANKLFIQWFLLL